MFDEKISVTRRRLMALGAGVVGASAVAALPLAKPAAAEPREGFYEHRIDSGAIIPRERIGIQLYTIGGAIGELGFAKVFERLSQIGYTEVEFAGYTRDSSIPNDASGRAQIKDLLQANGLTASGSHVSPSDANIDQLITEALEIGIPAIGIASLPQTFTQANADNWNRWAARAKESGLGFYLHNHSAELQTNTVDPADGQTKTPYEMFIDHTTDDVSFELDIYWAFNATIANPTLDPAALVTRHLDRFMLYHVKDGNAPSAAGLGNPIGLLTSGGGYTMTDVGQGSIDFETFFNTIRAADIAAGNPADGKHRGYMMESDATASATGKAPWRCATTSYGWMAHGPRIAGD